MLKNNKVSVFEHKEIDYPNIPPYHPSVAYPEYAFGDIETVDQFNNVYSAVRESFVLLGLDVERFGFADWNPLGGLISPGNTVVIKPNAVWDIIPNSKQTVFASITHGSVLRVVLDYTYKALGGRGRIIIADCPLAHSNFDNWKHITGVNKIAEWYKNKLNFSVEILDLRKLYAPWDFERSFSPAHLRQKEDRDPAGYLEVDLGATSEFASLTEDDCRLIYGSDYERKHTVKHHVDGHHRYCIAKTFLEADVLISVPKLKVHSKVGVTLNIKGMVGTQGDKNYIPHHRIGDPTRGGDEYPDLGMIQNFVNRYRNWMITKVLAKQNVSSDMIYKHLLFPIHVYLQRIAEKISHIINADYKGNILGGSWYGNDTAWRMALDLMRIVLYVDVNGQLVDLPQRKFFSVVDGIVGGEGEGPLSPTAKHCGVIISGFNPLAVDQVCARLMGFEPRKIRFLYHGSHRDWLRKWTDEEQIQIESNQICYQKLIAENGTYLNFTPPKGWKNFIEMNI